MAKTQKVFNEYRDGMNEGGEGYNPHATALAAERDRLEAQHEAAYETQRLIDLASTEAEWTADVTIARRLAWNAWVRSASAGGAQIAPAHVAAQVQAQGWNTDDLRNAIKRHGL